MPKKRANGRKHDRDTATVGSALDEVGFIPLGKRLIVGKREVRPTLKMQGKQGNHAVESQPPPKPARRKPSIT